MELYKQVEKYFINWLRKNVKFVIGAVLWGMIAYFTMMKIISRLQGVIVVRKLRTHMPLKRRRMLSIYVSDFN